MMYLFLHKLNEKWHKSLLIWNLLNFIDRYSSLILFFLVVRSWQSDSCHDAGSTSQFSDDPAIRLHVARCLVEWEQSFMLVWVTVLIRSIYRGGERPQVLMPSTFLCTTRPFIEFIFQAMCPKSLRIPICTIDVNLSTTIK